MHHAARIAHQAYGEREGQLAALRFVKQTGGKTGADRMQLQLRNLPLQAEQQAAVGATRIIDTVAIGDQTTSIATQI
jgi:hypothetical protein